MLCQHTNNEKLNNNYNYFIIIIIINTWEQQIYCCEGSQAVPIRVSGEGRLMIYFPVNPCFVPQKKLCVLITKISRIS
jgi:hypothetical protein